MDDGYGSASLIMRDSISKFRSLFMSLLGMRYRELPFGTRREDIEAALSAMQAEKRSESGSPAFEVNNEYFRIGRRRVRVCTEDEMFVSLWGPRVLVDSLYASITSSAVTKRYDQY